jgi:HlyD family secretion protein
MLWTSIALDKHGFGRSPDRAWENLSTDNVALAGLQTAPAREKREDMMGKRQVVFGLLMAVAVLLAAGCGGAGAPAETAATSADEEPRTLPVVATAAGQVIAEGTIEPARWSDLSAPGSGEVIELKVEDGAAVAAGAVLLRLNVDQLENALQSAEQDVISARAALDQLQAGATEAQIARADKENADAIAQAEVAVQAAKLRLEEAQANDPAAGVDAAKARITQLNRQVEQLRAQDPASGVAAAEVTVERAQIALDDAQDEYNKALDRPWEDQEIRDGWADQVTQKKLDMRAAQAQLDGAQAARTANARGLAVVTAQIEEAQVQVEQAETELAAYKVTLNALAKEVEAAELRLEALRTWENPLRDPPTQDEIKQAEARLVQAELAVSRLKLQIEDATLDAPFAGTAAEVYVEQGDQVSAGQPALTLATLDRLVVKTTDLTELDIAQVAVGQPVVVSLDALPDAEFEGRVAEIALRGGDYRGDIVYQVTVEFAESPDAPLLWGMTAMVKIDVK